MPEIVLRMKIANDNSLADLQDIFNTILNRVKQGKSPYQIPGANALYYFPEVFVEPRDLYVAAML